MVNFIKSLGCKLGWHHGNWDYTNAGECNQTRVCPACSEEESRVEHDVEHWRSEGILAQGQVGVCSRCQQELTRYKSKRDELQ